MAIIPLTEGCRRLILPDGYVIDVPEEKLEDLDLKAQRYAISDYHEEEYVDRELQDQADGSRIWVDVVRKRAKDVKRMSDDIRLTYDKEKKWDDKGNSVREVY